MNPELESRYAANRLGLTRQLHFSPRSEQSVDVTLSLNGIPVVTLELKNPLTGQRVAEAVRQYSSRTASRASRSSHSSAARWYILRWIPKRYA